MLDDLKMIHERDAQDALGIAEKQGQQLEYDFDLPSLKGKQKFENVVFDGMGGSALAALLSQSWPGYEIPFEVRREYAIPSYVSNNTLFFASSYSGNTEESVEALHSAIAKKAKIVVITSGGQLADLAREHDLPLALLPSGFQPRHAVLYSYKALAVALHHAGLISAETVDELTASSAFLKQSMEWWLPTVATEHNHPKQIALELMGKSPVLYAGPKMSPAAYKWKISFNENAKNVAWWDAFPEFNHNEFLGWTSHPIDKPYKPIILRSSFEHARVQKRFEVSARLLSGLWPEPIFLDPKGESPLQHLLWHVAFGDFVSLYLALLNGLNPTPVDLIEKFKKALNE